MNDQASLRRDSAVQQVSKYSSGPALTHTAPTVTTVPKPITLETLSEISVSMMQHLPTSLPAHLRKRPDPLDLILRHACDGHSPYYTAVVYPTSALKRLTDTEIDFRKALPGIGLLNANLNLSRLSSRQLLCQHKWRLSLDRSSPEMLVQSIDFFQHFALCFQALEITFNPNEDFSTYGLADLRDAFRAKAAMNTTRRLIDTRIIDYLTLDGKQELYKRYLQRLELLPLMTNVRYLTIDIQRLGFAAPDWTPEELNALPYFDNRRFEVRRVAYECLIAAIEKTRCWRLWYPRQGFMTKFTLKGLKRGEKMEDDVRGTWAKIAYLK